jgi:hypothetical protein
MPDGSYQYSQTSVAKAIDKDESSFRKFLASKRPEAIQCKELGSGKIEVDGNNRAINGIPGEAATIYWSYWVSKGDAEALALTIARTVEVLTRCYSF